MDRFMGERGLQTLLKNGAIMNEHDAHASIVLNSRGGYVEDVIAIGGLPGIYQRINSGRVSEL